MLVLPYCTVLHQRKAGFKGVWGSDPPRPGTVQQHTVKSISYHQGGSTRRSRGAQPFATMELEVRAPFLFLFRNLFLFMLLFLLLVMQCTLGGPKWTGYLCLVPRFRKGQLSFPYFGLLFGNEHTRQLLSALHYSEKLSDFEIKPCPRTQVLTRQTSPKPTRLCFATAFPLHQLYRSRSAPQPTAEPRSFEELGLLPPTEPFGKLNRLLKKAVKAMREGADVTHFMVPVNRTMYPGASRRGSIDDYRPSMIDGLIDESIRWSIIDDRLIDD